MAVPPPAEVLKTSRRPVDGPRMIWFLVVGEEMTWPGLDFETVDGL